MSARRTVQLGLCAGLLVAAAGLTGPAAWAEEVPGATPAASASPTETSAEPAPTEPAATPEPSAGPTEEPSADPVVEPSDGPSVTPTDEPSDATADGSGEVVCGTPGPDGIDPCILFASGGVPEGAVQKDATTAGAGAVQELPLTGASVGVLSAYGAGLVTAGAGAVLLGRRRPAR